MNNKKGFSLTELIIFVIILVILFLASIPIYKGFVKKARIYEGKVLLNEILVAEKKFYSKYGTFYNVSSNDGYSKILNLDARENKYYKSFTVTGGAIEEEDFDEDGDILDGISIDSYDEETFSATVYAKDNSEMFYMVLTAGMTGEVVISEEEGPVSVKNEKKQ